MISSSAAEKAITAMGLSTGPAVSQRKCPACEVIRPVDAFVALPDDERCNFCLLPDHSKEALRMKRVAAEKFLNEIFHNVGSGPAEVQKVSRLEGFLASIYDKMGGMGEVTTLMADNLKHVLVERRGSAMAINAITKLLALNRDVDKHRLDEDVRTMSDEQLRLRAQLELRGELIAALQDPRNVDALKGLVELVQAAGGLVVEYPVITVGAPQ